MEHASGLDKEEEEEAVHIIQSSKRKAPDALEA